MSLADLSFIDTARRMEVEAVEGGRALSEFTLDPESGGNDEEVRVHGKAVDDVEEGSERAGRAAGSRVHSEHGWDRRVRLAHRLRPTSRRPPPGGGAMNRVEFNLSYARHDGFQWCASLTLDGKTIKGWGESMERAAQDLEQQLREEAER